MKHSIGSVQMNIGSNLANPQEHPKFSSTIASMAPVASSDGPSVESVQGNSKILAESARTGRIHIREKAHIRREFHFPTSKSSNAFLARPSDSNDLLARNPSRTYQASSLSAQHVLGMQRQLLESVASSKRHATQAALSNNEDEERVTPEEESLFFSSSPPRSTGAMGPVSINQVAQNVNATGAFHNGSSGRDTGVDSRDRGTPLGQTSQDRGLLPDWSKVRSVQEELVSHNQISSELLRKFEKEYQECSKLWRESEAKFRRRITRLEDENAALRKHAATAKCNDSETRQLQEKYKTSQQALELLTEDLSQWETKSQKLQKELNAMRKDAATVERQRLRCSEQVDNLTKQLQDRDKTLAALNERIENGSEQLMMLQTILTRTDSVIIDRVKQLSSLVESGVGGDNGLAEAYVVQHATQLARIWSQFEEEYEGTLSS